MITAIGDVMRRAYKKGWITTRDGNISLRRSGAEIMHITPSGWRKTIIHPEHMIKCKFLSSSEASSDIENEFIWPINDMHARPSGEIHMHYLLQRDHNKTRAVVHLHPTNIIAAMYAGWDLQALAAEFPEVSRYTKVGPSVPVLPVISKELATATFEAMKMPGSSRIQFDIIGQANHGVCSIGDNPWDAYEHIERLEHICEIVLKSGVQPGK